MPKHKSVKVSKLGVLKNANCSFLLWCDLIQESTLEDLKWAISKNIRNANRYPPPKIFQICLGGTAYYILVIDVAC